MTSEVWTPVEPMADEPEQGAFWEPQRFEVGDRVRVRLSGECQSHGNAEVEPGVWKDSGHRLEMEGRYGVIGPCPDNRRSPCKCFAGHPYVARGISTPGFELTRFGHFAAVELERLP